MQAQRVRTWITTRCLRDSGFTRFASRFLFRVAPIHLRHQELVTGNTQRSKVSYADSGFEIIRAFISHVPVPARDSAASAPS
jgi:hypothetical protein